MTLNVRYADEVFGLSISATARLPGRALPLDPASAAAFLATRALSNLSPDGCIPFGVDELLWHMSFARSTLPPSAAFSFRDTALVWGEPRPEARTLVIDPDLGTFGVEDIVFEWRDLRRWAAAASGYRARWRNRDTTGHRIQVLAAANLFAIQLARYAEPLGIAWFDAACRLTRELLKDELFDPEDVLSDLSPDRAMARGYCMIDPFARRSVVSTGHQLGLTATGEPLALTIYARLLSSMSLNQMELAPQMIAANLGEGNYDQIDRMLSAHERIVLDQQLTDLTVLARDVVTGARQSIAKLNATPELSGQTDE